jgi:uncharacterized protein YkwD
MRVWSVLAILPLSACMTVLPLEQVVLDSAQTSVGGFATPATSPTDTVVSGSESFAAILNDERGTLSLVAVTPEPRLTEAAQSHAEDMAENNYLSHTGLDGSSAADRALAVGYDYAFIAENIAQGFYSEEAVLEAWMNSPGHAANILDDRAEDFGLGLEGDTWVLMLGAER